MCLLRSVRLWSVAAVLFASATAACNGPDVRGPFEGRIVDAETGAPIEGAIVVVAWTHVMNYFEGGRREVDAREAVTDAQGRWRIPERPTPFWEGGIAGVRRRFYVFAPGYDIADPSGISRDQNGGRETTVTRMNRLVTRDERCKVLPFVASTMSISTSEKSPRFREALARERGALDC